MAASFSGDENSPLEQSDLRTVEITSPQVSPPDHQQRVLPNRRVRTRGITSNKWTIPEKENILYCYYYSRTDVWGRANDVFDRRIHLMDLPPDKVETMTTAKWRSLCSQCTYTLHMRK